MKDFKNIFQTLIELAKENEKKESQKNQEIIEAMRKNLEVDNFDNFIKTLDKQEKDFYKYMKDLQIFDTQEELNIKTTAIIKSVQQKEQYWKYFSNPKEEHIQHYMYSQLKELFDDYKQIKQGVKSLNLDQTQEQYYRINFNGNISLAEMTLDPEKNSGNLSLYIKDGYAQIESWYHITFKKLDIYPIQKYEFMQMKFKI